MFVPAVILSFFFCWRAHHVPSKVLALLTISHLVTYLAAFLDLLSIWQTHLLPSYTLLAVALNYSFSIYTEYFFSQCCLFWEMCRFLLSPLHSPPPHTHTVTLPNNYFAAGRCSLAFKLCCVFLLLFFPNVLMGGGKAEYLCFIFIRSHSSSQKTCGPFSISTNTNLSFFFYVMFGAISFSLSRSVQDSFHCEFLTLYDWL